jgi:sialic acid synthase SpsE
MLKIGKHKIGKKVFVVAEAGVNHNGSVPRAKELINKAADSGADAVKFQTYKAGKLVTKTAPKFWDWEGDKDKKTQYDAYDDLDDFPMGAYPALIEVCNKRGVEFLSTPFDFESADYLNSIGMPAFKIASSDITYIPFLKHIAQFKKPIILSTGASTISDIDEAVRTIKGEGNDQIILLQCTLKYPTPAKDANLRIIPTLQTMFPDLMIGLSDHTMGINAPIVATTLGAKLIEKHYTVDKSLLKSADHWLSVDPPELKAMVKGIRDAEAMLGSNEKKVFDCEDETRVYDKRSIVANTDINKGTKITRSMLMCKRPGMGIAPQFMDIIVGRIARENIKEDEIINWNQI